VRGGGRHGQDDLGNHMNFCGQSKHIYPSEAHRCRSSGSYHARLTFYDPLRDGVGISLAPLRVSPTYSVAMFDGLPIHSKTENEFQRHLDVR